MMNQWSMFLPIGSAKSFFIKAAAQDPPKFASSFSSWIIPLKFKKKIKTKLVFQKIG